jgi:hypothetical protein
MHIATIARRSNEAMMSSAILLTPNVRGHRADEMKDATTSDASEAPGGLMGWTPPALYSASLCQAEI